MFNPEGTTCGRVLRIALDSLPPMPDNLTGEPWVAV
jgi:hypothetical protein